MIQNFIGVLVCLFCLVCLGMFATCSWRSETEHDPSLIGTSLFYAFLGGIVGWWFYVKTNPPAK